MSARRGPPRTSLLTTGDMARLSGNTLRTVRFYEEAGLLTPNERTDGGHRLFERRELEKLTLVTELRTAGLSLDDIRSLLAVKRAAATGGLAAEQLRRRLDEYVARLDARLELLGSLRGDLVAAREHLSGCRGCNDRVRFPDACGTCQVMTKSEAVPTAISVLWQVARRSDRD